MKISLPLFKYARPTLAYIIVIGSFGYLFTLLFVRVPAENRDLVSQTQGFLLAVVAVVAGYYFGASKDKSDADQSKIFPKDPPNP